VVDDDLMIGLRWLLEDVPATADPLDALAHAYLERSSYSPVQHDPRKQKEAMLLRRVRGSGRGRRSSRRRRCASRGSRSRWATCTRSRRRRCRTSSPSSREHDHFDTLEIQLETFVENLLFD